jgi:hypothetical protein
LLEVLAGSTARAPARRFGRAKAARNPSVKEAALAAVRVTQTFAPHQSLLALGSVGVTMSSVVAVWKVHGHGHP